MTTINIYLKNKNPLYVVFLYSYHDPKIRKCSFYFTMFLILKKKRSLYSRRRSLSNKTTSFASQIPVRRYKKVFDKMKTKWIEIKYLVDENMRDEKIPVFYFCFSFICLAIPSYPSSLDIKLRNSSDHNLTEISIILETR